MTTSEQTGIKIDFNDALLSHLASFSINSLGYTPTMDAKSLQTPIYSAISIKEIRTYKRLMKMSLNATNRGLFLLLVPLYVFRIHNKCKYLLLKNYSHNNELLECEMNQAIIKYLSLAAFL